MAQRGFWKGYLRLSLVTCRVAMTPATTRREKVRFHTLNRATGNRVESRYVDAVTGKPVREADEARGYPAGEGSYVVLEDDELEAAALDSTRTIDIETFVPRDSIGWIWLDSPHYLLPDDEIAQKAFAVIRDAMDRTGTAGIARLVLYRRERAVMLEPRDRGIVVWTLRYGDEVRDPAGHFAGIDADKPDAKTLALVARLIDRRTAKWDPAMVRDPVQDRLLDIIEARRSRRKPARAARRQEPQDTPGNVVSILDALRRSVDAEKGGGKRGGRG